MGPLLVVLFVGAGIGKALADAIAHGSTRLSERGPWWNNATSWTRKYKDYYGGDKRPRFFGATTVLVFLTDGWHAFNALTWACADAAFLLAAWTPYKWGAVAAVVVRRCIFQPIYSYLRKP